MSLWNRVSSRFALRQGDLILRVLAEEGFESVCLAPEMTKGGSIETYQDALLCAELFRKNADRIDKLRDIAELR